MSRDRYSRADEERLIYGMPPRRPTTFPTPERYIDRGVHVGTRREEIRVTAVVAPDAATVLLSPTETTVEQPHTGRAWKSPSDDPDPEVGYRMALGRALESMGRDLQRQAWRAIHDKERA